MATISGVELKRPVWQTTGIFTLAFWLSSSLILDLVIMPSLYATGMMTQAGFATAGYSIFWIFNRIELVCAALVLTSILAAQSTQQPSFKENRSIILSVILLGIALIYTYFLTPEMSALGLQLNLFDSTTVIPANMNQMHVGYWLLEALKLIGCSTLLGLCYRNSVE